MSKDEVINKCAGILFGFYKSNKKLTTSFYCRSTKIQLVFHWSYTRSHYDTFTVFSASQILLIFIYQAHLWTVQLLHAFHIKTYWPLMRKATNCTVRQEYHNTQTTNMFKFSLFLPRETSCLICQIVLKLNTTTLYQHWNGNTGYAFEPRRCLIETRELLTNTKPQSSYYIYIYKFWFSKCPAPITPFCSFWR